MINRGTGWVPDNAGHQVTPIRHLFAKAGAAYISTPASVDLRDAVLRGPGVMDQGATNSCVGHSIVGAVETRFADLEQPLAHLSPVSVYDWARMIDASPGEPLVDFGCQPSSAIRGIEEWGIAKLETRLTSPLTINQKPKLGEYESAEGFKLNGAYRIDGDRQTRIDNVCQALAIGIPVTFALRVDDAFENYTGGLYTPGGAVKGGHYMYVASFYTQSDGSKVFGIVNSWGQWGEGGFARMHESIVDGWMDIYGLSVGVVAQ